MNKRKAEPSGSALEEHCGFLSRPGRRRWFQQQGSQPQSLLLPQPQPQLLLLLQPQPQLFPPPQQQHTRMMIRMIQQQLPLLPNMNDTPRFQSLEGPSASAGAFALQLAYSM